MRRALLAAALCAAVLCRPVPAPAQEAAPGAIMSFADHLFGQGDYYRAVTEYERLVFFHPDHPLAKTARFRIAMCYFKGEKWAQAARRFRDLSERYPDEETGRKSRLMLADAYYFGKDYDAAIGTLQSFIEASPGDPQADAARLRLGRCHLRKGDWKRAAESFDGIAPGSPLRPGAATLAAGSREYPRLPRKSPPLAGGLSALLPGAGQLYIGRPSDAAAAFLLNGLFIWAAVEAFDKGNNVTGGILLAFESGWYFGNIFNAVTGAHQYNRRAERNHVDDLLNRSDTSPGEAGGGVRLPVLSLRF